MVDQYTLVPFFFNLRNFNLRNRKLQFIIYEAFRRCHAVGPWGLKRNKYNEYDPFHQLELPRVGLMLYNHIGRKPSKSLWRTLTSPNTNHIKILEAHWFQKGLVHLPNEYETLGCMIRTPVLTDHWSITRSVIYGSLPTKAAKPPHDQ